MAYYPIIAFISSLSVSSLNSVSTFTPSAAKDSIMLTSRCAFSLSARVKTSLLRRYAAY